MSSKGEGDEAEGEEGGRRGQVERCRGRAAGEGRLSGMEGGKVDRGRQVKRGEVRGRW